MSELSDLYQEVILDHGRRPRNFGPLEGATHHAEGLNPLCGDHLTVHARLEGGRVADVRFEGSGCAISKASASVMTGVVKGLDGAGVDALFERFHRLVTEGDAGGGAELGKLAGLDIATHSLNIYSMIGLVLLIGLVAKNSILLVDLSNQRRAQGMTVNEALANACPIRMRPVLMTSLTLILALLPASLGLGAGAETNAPLAIAVIGGMITSTLLTLVVVPAAYSLVENWRERRSARASGGAPALDSPQGPKQDD